MKKLILTAVTVLMLTGVGFADENTKHNSVSLNLGTNFGNLKLQDKPLDMYLGNIEDSNNFGLTYFYNFEALKNTFSLGARVQVNSYSGSVNVQDPYQDNDTTMVNDLDNFRIDQTYSAFLMGKIKLFNIARLDTNIIGGVGIGINKVSYNTSTITDTYDVVNQNDTISRMNTSGTSDQYSFAYTIGLSEDYKVSDTIGIGLEIAYTNLGSPELLKAVKYNNNGMLNTSFAIKFNL